MKISFHTPVKFHLNSADRVLLNGVRHAAKKNWAILGALVISMCMFVLSFALRLMDVPVGLAYMFMSLSLFAVAGVLICAGVVIYDDLKEPLYHFRQLRRAHTSWVRARADK